MTPGIYAQRFDELDTVIQLGVASGQVIDVSFPDEVPADAETDHEVFGLITDYLNGDRLALTDVEIALTVPTDQRQVLDALQNVSAGNTVSVSRLARLAGMDEDSEEDNATVRDALRANPIPLVIPDHRVHDAQGATPPDVAAALRRLEE
ncbi:methylated-DNA--[protein]-cysteine S-methyltransferase [Halonotius terrestris]|uniref:Methylated-DNA--[protein]-cysteine S-methyltransferase n=1 Tax=Halonotius terrestris TaxID=2487750 RepID=A0A8J8PDY3_9EURY|nr:MGMT family protein [Halonotius terrestris]TQQ82839.1 methylated-DNA--[protein]-cysteine S-methyltransferase [Halonotius terrestris]